MSPAIHAAFAKDAGIDIEYTVIECPRDGFLDAVRQFREAGGRGLNVTAPFKLDAYRLADHRSERVEIAGSVNTLRFDGATVAADNFDGVGLIRDITTNLDSELTGTRILLLGAGGAARGLLQPLVEQRPNELVIANRTSPRAREVAGLVGPDHPVRGGGYDEIGEGEFDVVINATSASIEGAMPPLAAAHFAPGGIAYELAYGLGVTPFLALARTAGAGRIVDGVGMLVEQAAEAFAWWRGIRPDTRAMIEALTIPLV
jgi:shikimate dehydrogenase